MTTPRPGDPASVVQPRRAYCTYFDSCYLARGLTMLRSLQRHDPSAPIQVLALDDLCERVLREVLGSSITVLNGEAIYAYDRSLAARGAGRSTWAFYATHKPVLVLFTLQPEQPPPSVTFIDADTWFFADPSPMFAEIGSASIGLSPHRFHTASQHLAIYGTYNAGCIYWRTDATARQCVEEWRNQCLEWCEAQVGPDGRFMNQGYLNRWPERYPGVHIITHPGVNLAPWNIDGHVLDREGAAITVDGRPLIFYHFSGLVYTDDNGWHSFYPHLRRQSEFARDAIYGPYLAAVEAEHRLLRNAYGITGTSSVRQLALGPEAIRLHPDPRA